MKTSELKGAALDWAVAKAEGLSPLYLRGCDFEPAWRNGHRCRYSTDWAQGGPIIERERIGPDEALETFGQAFLSAALRTYVSAKLGEEVDIPAELKD